MAKPPEALDVHPLIKKFLKKQQAMSQNTYEVRQGNLRDFDQWLSEQGHDLEGVTPWILDDYFTHQKKEGYAPKTIKGRWDSINQLFKFLSLRDIVDENPIQADEIERKHYTDSKARKHVENDEPSYVTKEEMERLVANVPGPKLRNKLLIRLMWQTGVRSNEVTRIRLSDLSDWNGETQELEPDERSIEVYSKKTGDTRTVYYQDSLDFLLTEWLNHGYRASFTYAADSEYLFLTRKGPKVHDERVNPIVKRAAENAGIQEELYADKNNHTRYRITAHALRHGHAVYSLKCGIDIRTISKHMGHESLEMTKRYLNLIDEDVRDAYRKNWGRV